jgi:ribonuclease D
MSVDLPMSEQTRDWTRRPLSPAQLAYAALDADVLLPLAEVLGV